MSAVLFPEVFDDLDDLRADSLLGLLGGGSDVRRAGDVGVGVQRRVGGGFISVNVQSSGPDLAGVKGLAFFSC